MKKQFFFAAVALVALASCSSEDFIGDSPTPNPNGNGPETAIVFNSGANAITRADQTGATAAGTLGNNFVVEGVKWDGGTSDKTVVFNNYNVNYAENSANTTTSNTAGWEYVAQAPHYHGLNTVPKITEQSIKYWDYSKSQYDFIAYSIGTIGADNGIYNPSTAVSDGKVKISAIDFSKMNGVKTGDVYTGGAYTIEGAAEDLAKVYIADMETAYRGATPATGDYQKTVQFTFRSLSAKVRVALYETVPGYSVKDVVFYTDADTKATDGKAHLYTQGTDVFNEKGTYFVYFPTTGSDKVEDKDYNKAHLGFTAASSGGTSKDKTFGAFAYSEEAASKNTTFVDKEVNEAAGKTYIGRFSNQATYAGIDTESGKEHFYTTVIPNEDGAVLNLKVDYTLLSTDGSTETIKVTGATAKVPAEYASWKSGYAYTYIFKISQNTNGLTNPDIDIAGLYPITFDAVVTESEEHVQETITTVADPSITTYSKGVVVTAKDEYITGQNIYAVVNDGTDNLALDGKAELYTVTLTKGAGAAEGSEAAQTINEASVDNALAHGVHSSGTYTVTDANKWNLVVTDASSSLTITNKIDDANSPTGKEIIFGANKIAYFNPSAAGIYVFRYVKTAHVDGTPAVYYSVDECNTYNKENVTGALSTDALTAEEALAYNTFAGTSKSAGDVLTAQEVYDYNATLEGARKTTDVKTDAVAEVPGEYYYKIIKVVAP